MRFMLKSLAILAAVAVLFLAAYGGWALLRDDTGSTDTTAAASTTATTATEATTQQVQLPSQTSPQRNLADAVQGGWQDEMVRLCSEHLKEMEPVMEQMMSEMMAQMMDDGMMGR